MKLFLLVTTFVLSAQVNAKSMSYEVVLRKIKKNKTFKILPNLIRSKLGEIEPDFTKEDYDYFILSHNLNSRLVRKMKKEVKNGRFNEDSFFHYIDGNIYYLKGNKRRALSSFRKCVTRRNSAETVLSSVEKIREKLTSKCLLNIARILFETKSYDKSMRVYAKIKKENYLWPYTLLDKGWIMYWNENYNRTLGILNTFKSPLMGSYYDPEADLLMSISYYRMCYFNDIKKIINNFSKKSKKLYSVYKKLKADKKLVKKVKAYEEPLIKQVFLPLRKTIEFKIYVWQQEQIKIELEKIGNAMKRSRKSKFIYRHLYNMLKEKKKEIDYNLGELVYGFIQRKGQKVSFVTNELQKIYLQNLTEWRKKIYKDQKLATPEKRGSQSYVRQEGEVFFWNYRGAFWIDELGEYTFGLANNCKGEQ